MAMSLPRACRANVMREPQTINVKPTINSVCSTIMIRKLAATVRRYTHIHTHVLPLPERLLAFKRLLGQNTSCVVEVVRRTSYSLAPSPSPWNPGLSETKNDTHGDECAACVPRKCDARTYNHIHTHALPLPERLRAFERLFGENTSCVAEVVRRTSYSLSPSPSPGNSELSETKNDTWR
jgi:hypothetical protein